LLRSAPEQATIETMPMTPAQVRYGVHEPVERLDPVLRIIRHQLSGLLGTIENDRGRLRNGDRRAARTVVIDDGRNGSSRVDRGELRFALIPFVQIESVNTMCESTLCQCERSAAAIHRRGSEKIDHPDNRILR
jgi:hypothetical protein